MREKKTPCDRAHGEGAFTKGKGMGKREGREEPRPSEDRSRREERGRSRETGREEGGQVERERWEMGRAFLIGNVVSVHRRCS